MTRKKLVLISVLVALDMAMLASLFKFWPWNPSLEVHVLDVGQGDSVLIVTPEQHHILVDGGPGTDVLTELAAVLPFFFSELDLVVLTHPHADHVEGLVEVMRRFRVGAVLLSAPEYDNLAYEAFMRGLAGVAGGRGGIPLYFAESGMDFLFGETVLDVLYPFEPLTSQVLEDVNNASPVILVEWQGDESENARILLTGDAEAPVEEALLTAGTTLQADILKAGHHGSRSSSTLGFLEAVMPEMVLISVGEGNSYGHPHEETLENAEAVGATVFRTDLQGRISLIFEGGAPSEDVASPDGGFWRRVCGVFRRSVRNLDRCS